MVAKLLGESKTFNDVKNRETIISFLDTRKKAKKIQNKNG
jgi:hypothetical protein